MDIIIILTQETRQIQYCYFYSNTIQKIFQLSLRKGLKSAKTKFHEILSITGT
jgi:hypothetical protein